MIYEIISDYLLAVGMYFLMILFVALAVIAKLQNQPIFPFMLSAFFSGSLWIYFGESGHALSNVLLKIGEQKERVIYGKMSKVQKCPD